MLKCRICGGETSDRPFMAREMMLGLRDEHPYFECGACGCVQQVRPPDDLSRYYPSTYYSYTPPRPNGPLKRFLKRHLARSVLGAVDPLGMLLRLGRGVPVELGWVRRTGATLEDPILDIGCGAGHLLHWLDGAGFRDLTGADPFIPRDVRHRDGFNIWKRRIAEVRGSYALVILNHSLEHMSDPADVLAKVSERLRPGGTALIRLPLAGSHAWRTYGKDWVGLDPPRHVFLPTDEGFRAFLRRAGFSIVEVVHDSTSMQFWASEQYRRDIPLMDERSFAVSARNAPFSPGEIRKFGERAMDLNRRSDGDQAAFFVQH